jgi:CDGSH-type Zn-finger protein
MENVENITITIIENGPLKVKGRVTVIGKDGKEEIKEKITAFCRCAHSDKQPYCDGKHKHIDFIG